MNLDLAKALDRRLGSLLGRGIGTADRWVGGSGRRAAPPRIGRILLTKFWGLGNWALLRPILRDVRARWPSARILVATLEGNAWLVEDLADEVLIVRPSTFSGVVRDLQRAVRRLRRRPLDLSLDFEQFSRSGALLARLGGAARRVGFACDEAGRDGLYTVLVPFRRGEHVSRAFRDIAEAGGIGPAPYVPGALSPDGRGRGELERIGVEEGVPYVVLHPGSGDNFRGRRWPAASFSAVGRAAAAADHRVFVTGSASERTLAARVARGIPGASASLAGRMGLRGLVALLAGARALVSNDTGPVHVASALGVPTLAMYGPNTPRIYGPLAPGSRAFYRGLPCSPCLTEANYRSSRCRIHVCMDGIPTGEVATALSRLLVEVPA